MSNLTAYQRESIYETTLAQDIDSTTTSISVTTGVQFTLSSGSFYIAIDSDNSDIFEICEVTGVSGTTFTVTRGVATYEGGGSSANSHTAGARILIGASWKNFADIATAVNSKLDSNGGNQGTTFDLNLTGSNWRLRKDGNDMKFTDDNQSEVTLSTLAATGGADEKVKVSIDDTTADYLFAKVVGGDGVSATETNPGGDEDLTLAVDLAANTGLDRDWETNSQPWYHQ